MKENSENFDVEVINHAPFESIQIESYKADCTTSFNHFKKAFHFSFYVEHAGIYYTIQGTKCMMVNNRIFYLNAGDMMYVPKNSIIFSNTEKCKIAYKGLDIELLPEKLEKYLSTKKNNYSNLTFKPFAIYGHSQVKATFSDFLKVNSIQNNELAYHKLLNSLIEILAPTLFSFNSKSSTNNNSVSIISRTIINTLYDNLTIEQMAFQCNMSLASFKRNFKAEFGIAPKKWVRNMKLQTAYFNLRTNNMNVSEVAYFTGFNSLPHFSFLFKKYYAISPSTLLSKQ